MIAHVIEHRAHRMNAAIMAVWRSGGPNQAQRVEAIEQAADYRHGWYFDPMTGTHHKNDGGRGIVWADQPVMD